MLEIIHDIDVNFEDLIEVWLRSLKSRLMSEQSSKCHNCIIFDDHAVGVDNFLVDKLHKRPHSALV